jgi:hypothetical protein
MTITEFLKQAQRAQRRVQLDHEIARGLLGLFVIFSTLCVLVVMSARADSRPPPVPARGGLCPSGFTYSPTSDFCTPNPGTRSNAVPKQGYAPCPIGTHESMQSFCVQERR